LHPGLLIPGGTCGISNPFGLVSRTAGQVTNALLTRSPLTFLAKCPFDLHVLGTPPAFILSQDQTLRNTFSLCKQRSVYGLLSKKIDRALFPSYHSSIVKVLPSPNAPRWLTQRSSQTGPTKRDRCCLAAPAIQGLICKAWLGSCRIDFHGSASGEARSEVVLMRTEIIPVLSNLSRVSRKFLGFPWAFPVLPFFGQQGLIIWIITHLSRGLSDQF
jgi:hypothetical protein